MRAGSALVQYGIYQDAGTALAWGDVIGTNSATIASGTGTLTAYGRVPPQPSALPGAYVDVVNVTIIY